MTAIDTLTDALFGNPPAPDFKPSRQGVSDAFDELYNYQKPDAAGSVKRPYINKFQERRDLMDFVDKSQWPAIAAGNTTVFATNSSGQDAMAHAIADLPGAVGGHIRLPDGKVRLPPQVINRSYMTLFGNGPCSRVETTSATADLFDYQAPFTITYGMQVLSSVPRTAGAFFRARNEATRFWVEDIEAHGAFRLLQIDGHVTDPTMDTGFFTGKNLRAYETVVGGEAFYIQGGYVIDLEKIITAGDNSQKSLTGLRVKRCADVRVLNAQLLNSRRPLLIDPETSHSAASFKMHHAYLGTSLLGSKITDENGGFVLSMEMLDVWAGESEQAGAHGLMLNGALGNFKGCKLTDMEHYLCQGDGLNATGVKGLQVTGIAADGNTAGSGIALTNMVNPSVIGIRSGAERFGGNLYGVFESGNTHMTLIGNARGNGTNFSNASGTSGNTVVVLT